MVKSVYRSWALGQEMPRRAGSETHQSSGCIQAHPASPTKSSLLQVFVSISGLVLVRHPYHCEPAFAKLEGTKEGLINS